MRGRPAGHSRWAGELARDGHIRGGSRGKCAESPTQSHPEWLSLPSRVPHKVTRVTHCSLGLRSASSHGEHGFLKDDAVARHPSALRATTPGSFPWC